MTISGRFYILVFSFSCGSVYLLGIKHVLWHPQTDTATDFSQLLFGRDGPVSARKLYRVMDPIGQR